ncbi:MAG: inorganic diphosphatase [Planctomycetes bacterium]|nr:inorganic diphosphatase [Planctomycetota bacterium]MCB9868821.1 inorganic diphosphatase [Planctomycetota bacterium]
MVHPWHDIPVDPDRVAEEFPAVIEVPRGSVNKYELDKATGLLRLDRVLHSAVHYPADYGFVPRTLCEDGDAIDVLVLSQGPVHPLTIVRARPIGMFRMRDEAGADDKILAISLGDPAWRHVRHHCELPEHITNQILRFFADYKALEHKEVVVERMLGPEEAVRAVRGSLEAYERSGIAPA